MSGFMPYVLDKGPYFEVIESKLADPATRAHALRDLRNNVPIADLVGFDSTNLGADGRTPDTRKQHLNSDWFGVGGPMFWLGYAGNPELILRNAMERAIEMSFGLEHCDPVPTDAQAASGRHWPIDLYWICQGPWFQCWVLWRKADQGQGHVTLLITTPAAAGLPLTSKITRPVDPLQAAYTAPDYAHPPEALAPPPRASLPTGVWVLGHEDYTRELVPSTMHTKFGDIRLPVMGWSAIDPTSVECVSPAEWEGGVLDVPRPYQPPSSPE
jgi:hypothetical protein